MTEGTDHTVEGTQRQFVSPEVVDWNTHLNMIQFAIKNAWQETVHWAACDCFMMWAGYLHLFKPSSSVHRQTTCSCDAPNHGSGAFTG